MKVGIGLPGQIPGTNGELIVAWARKAEEGPFSSFATVDRLVFPNLEPLMCLGVAAAVTSRMRLMTTVLLGPLRNAGVLAKQAATLDVLSGGRLTLGLGVGGREDDFLAAPARFGGRGRRFEGMLELMKRAWSGENLSDEVGPMGPAPVQSGGPEILIGGNTPAALSRAGRLGDGFVAGGGGGPAGAEAGYRMVEEAWRESGRSGKPRFVGIGYFALGPGGLEKGSEVIRSYYGARAESVLNNTASTPEQVKSTIQSFADVGLDEYVFMPSIPELEQVGRLADAVG